MILLRGIQLTHVQRYLGSTVKIVCSFQSTFHEANTCVALPRTPDGVRCALFHSVITTIIDHIVQLLKPLNIRELNTT
jgi:hypothetical protein